MSTSHGMTAEELDHVVAVHEFARRQAPSAN